MQVLIVTGMSGAGKSTAMKMLEDMGFFCMDNLPVALIEKFMELTDQEGNQFQRVAMSVDIRSGSGLEDFMEILNKLQQDKRPEILFLDASDEVLVKRYKETRRSHPLSGTSRVEAGIVKERERIQFLRDEADYIIDTSQLLTRELNAALEEIFLKGSEFHNLYVTVLSFGFKYGIPSDSDLAFDVRFLPNPYYIEELRNLTGNDQEVYDYVIQKEETIEFIEKMTDLFDYLFEKFEQEGKMHLVVGIGCTGGQHRSVTLTNYFANYYSEKYQVHRLHRDALH